MPVIKLDQDECINCKTCVTTCPMGVFEDMDEKIVVAAQDECIICRACEAACPTEAIIVIE